MDCVFPAALSLPILPALELPEFAVLLFELLGLFPVLADELVSVGEIIPPELALFELPLSLAVPAESPEVDCAFPAALPLVELLAPLRVVADGLLTAGVVVVEPPLLEPLFDGELSSFPLFDTADAELLELALFSLPALPSAPGLFEVAIFELALSLVVSVESPEVDCVFPSALLVLSRPLAELPELDCAFPTALSLPLLPDDELFAFELLALPVLPLFELLVLFPVVVDELLSVGVVVLDPPLLEPLLDGELLVFPLFDAGEAELPSPEVDCALPVLLLDDELPVFELFPLLVGAAEFEPPLFALPALLVLAPPLLDAGEAELPLPDVD